jgi:hypothetical protein
MDHPAARSSASSETTDVKASTCFLALLFCGLLFFVVRFRLILAFLPFAFWAWDCPLISFHAKALVTRV